MSRGPSTFRQRDLTRALRGAQAAGVELARVEIGRDGRIIMDFGKPTEAQDANGERNELDDAA